MTQPMSMSFEHLLTFLCATFLPLLIMTTAMTHKLTAKKMEDVNIVPNILSIAIIILQIVLILSLRVIGYKFQKPYGGDVEHFPVLSFIQTAMSKCEKMQLNNRPIILDQAEVIISRDKVNLSI